jgi:hypothetical protein
MYEATKPTFTDPYASDVAVVQSDYTSKWYKRSSNAEDLTLLSWNCFLTVRADCLLFETRVWPESQRTPFLPFFTHSFDHLMDIDAPAPAEQEASASVSAHGGAHGGWPEYILSCCNTLTHTLTPAQDEHMDASYGASTSGRGYDMQWENELCGYHGTWLGNRRKYRSGGTGTNAATLRVHPLTDDQLVDLGVELTRPGAPPRQDELMPANHPPAAAAAPKTSFDGLSSHARYFGGIL